MHQIMNRLHQPSLGLLALRVAVGVVFLYHGWMKVGDIEPVIGFFGSLGFAPWMAHLVAWVETLGGAALILGVLTRYAAALTAIVAAVALFKVHLPNGFGGPGGYEFTFVLLLCSIAILTLGAGTLALGRHISKHLE